MDSLTHQRRGTRESREENQTASQAQGSSEWRRQANVQASAAGRGTSPGTYLSDDSRAKAATSDGRALTAACGS